MYSQNTYKEIQDPLFCANLTFLVNWSEKQLR
jgi:hypothetical protein